MNVTVPSIVKDKLTWAFTRLHGELYQRTGGKVGQQLGPSQILLLTTTGRTSGQPRTTPLSFIADDDVRVLIASYGGDDRHPQWYQNLLAHPEATIQVGPKTEQVRARTATPEEKARYWPKMVAMYKGYDGYQRRTERDIPVVLLEPA